MLSRWGTVWVLMLPGLWVRRCKLLGWARFFLYFFYHFFIFFIFFYFYMGKVARVTGLDPAKPFFELATEEDRIDKWVSKAKGNI